MLTAVTALLIPAFALPGAYLIYLPILAILLSFIALVRSARKLPKHRIQFAGWLILLVLLVLGFASLFDIASNKYQETSLFAEQFKRVTNLDDPSIFRSKALALHSELMSKNLDQRMISGDSALVPAEMRRVKPVSILSLIHI